MSSRNTTLVLLSAFLLGMTVTTLAPHTQAGRIDPERAAVVHAPTGLKIVQRDVTAASLFDFAPFAAHAETRVPGFSDPLGAGWNGSMSVLKGSVQNIDILGDFHPTSPFDPSDGIPTQDNLQASYLLSILLHGAPLPSKKDLVTSQLNLTHSPLSQLSDRPKTVETTPLILAGFGSVTEKPGPVSLHWTQCPDYTLKRYLIALGREKQASPAVRRNQPRLDCLVI
ncbi:MAG: hypothetical protein KDI09_05750 [Halioglobus sp.]|nr:hypothetical protein [Halioglobus sp.]